MKKVVVHAHLSGIMVCSLQNPGGWEVGWVFQLLLLAVKNLSLSLSLSPSYTHTHFPTHIHTHNFIHYTLIGFFLVHKSTSIE